jgi:hypothetical protein
MKKEATPKGAQSAPTGAGPSQGATEFYRRTGVAANAKTVGADGKATASQKY